MSIYIPSKPMPQNCAGCDFCADGWCYVISADQEQPGELSSEKRPDWCPLVEVPPHGALGDLDALAAKDNEDYEEAINCALSDSSRALMDQIHESAQMMIKKAETIIPADSEEST